MHFELPPMTKEHIAQFTGRIWLVSRLLDWLEQTNERIFLLTGGPGTGKSMIAAWLAGEGPIPADSKAHIQFERLLAHVKAAHFCVAGTGSADPRNMAKGIAKQLAKHTPNYSAALADTLNDRVRIVALQHTGTIETGGLQVGVSIQNLHLDALSGVESFNRVLRDPLKELYRRGYSEMIVLVVDALDEAVYFTEKPDIVELLAGISDLPAQVRILATTRNDPRVLKFYRDAIIFDLNENVQFGVDDVRSYISGQPDLVGLGTEKRRRLAERISKAAEGNFLYVYLVLNDPTLRLLDFAEPETLPLPKGLAGLYQQFLNRELGKDEDRWFSIYEPMLGVIAVSQGQGLSLAQLTGITGQDIRAALRACAQYLNGPWPDGPYRVFHKSFADFLLEDPKNADYHIDTPTMHRRIATYYQKWYRNRWKVLDEYGISNLLRHVIESDIDHRWKRTLDEYGIRFLFYHLISAGYAKDIGRVVDAGV